MENGLFGVLEFAFRSFFFSPSQLTSDDNCRVCVLTDPTPPLLRESACSNSDDDNRMARAKVYLDRAKQLAATLVLSSQPNLQHLQSITLIACESPPHLGSNRRS